MYFQSQNCPKTYRRLHLKKIFQFHNTLIQFQYHGKNEYTFTRLFYFKNYIFVFDIDKYFSQNNLCINN